MGLARPYVGPADVHTGPLCIKIGSNDKPRDWRTFWSQGQQIDTVVPINDETLMKLFTSDDLRVKFGLWL